MNNILPALRRPPAAGGVGLNPAGMAAEQNPMPLRQHLRYKKSKIQKINQIAMRSNQF